MFNYYFFILILSKYIYFAEDLDQKFTAYSCYESFSSPTQFIELYNYFPTSPPNLFIIFIMKIYQFESSEPSIILDESYDFKRINGPCKNTLKFTTKQIIFTKMKLIINVHLFGFGEQIDEIVYIFYPNFNPGFRLLIAKFSNIGLMVQVKYHGTDYIQKNLIVFPIDISYIQYIIHGYSDICIFTLNNLAVIIRPDPIDQHTPLIILGIIGEFTLNGIIHERYGYPAFPCQSNEKFPNEFVYFIDEQPQNAILNFKYIYLEHNEIGRYVFTKNFNIKHMKRIHVNESKNIPSYIQRVYFIKFLSNVTRISNGVFRFDLLTSDGIIYSSRICKYNTVSPNVDRWEAVFTRSTSSSG